MTDIPKPNEIYRHFKGNLYRIITVATHSETREQMVVYQALYGDYQAYVRPLEMFVSDVDRQKYPDVAQKKRFEKIPQVGEMTQLPVAEVMATPAGLRTPSAGQSAVATGQTLSGQEAASAAATGQTPPVQEVAPAAAAAQSPVAAPAEPEAQASSAETSQLLLTEGESELDPFLLGFLDADTYEEKLNFLVGLHARLTDHMVNTMAASLDVEINEGSLEERYDALKNCLLTLERYECARIR